MPDPTLDPGPDRAHRCSIEDVQRALRALESDGVVLRTARPVVPPHVEYRLTDLGEQLRPALEALLDWSELRTSAASEGAASEGAASEG